MLYYYIDNAGQQQGPVSIEQLAECNITPATMVWNETMPQWQTAGSVPELAALFAQQAPVLPPTPDAQAPKNNKRTYIIAGIVAGVLVAGAAVAFFLLRDNKHNTADDGDEVETEEIAEAPEAEPEPAFVAQVSTTTMKRSSYFIAPNEYDMESGMPIDFFKTKSFEIEWPNEANFDIAPLQEALCYMMFKKRTTSLNDASRSFLTNGKDDSGNSWSSIKSLPDYAHDQDEYNSTDEIYCKRDNSGAAPTNMVIFTAGGYEFQGGAHGSPYQLGVVNYDCQQGHVVSYDDIIRPGSDSKILNLLIASGGYDRSMGTPNRIPKDMMTIYSDRIKFAYGVYEIGSYADGEVELTLSLSQIESFLTDYGKELFARPQVEY